MSISNSTDVLPIQLLGKANDLIKDLSKDQLIWLGGYLSGLALNGQDIDTGELVNEQRQLESNVELTVLVGSQSGNAKIIAKHLSELAEAKNAKANVLSMADYKVKNLKDEKNLVVIVSTHGEGEPPAAAEDLHRLIDTKRAGNLSGLNFSVIALGDSSYKNYCQTGIDFHERLKKRGATALSEPLLLDVDFQDQLEEVTRETLKLFKPTESNISDQTEKATTNTVSSNGIYQAEVLDKVLLNGKGSAKETYHIELSLEDSGLEYQPGDALEVFGVNDESLVNDIISKLELNADELVDLKSEKIELKTALQHYRELTLVTLPVMKKLSAYVTEPVLNTLLDNRDELDKYLEGRDLLDLINDFRFKLTAQQLVDSLRALPPRAYSIASSQSEVGDEVHLTVGAVRYEKNERVHEGVCSTFLADRIATEEKLGVRIKQNEGFRLPETDKPIIMIGPGTGIAPFRSFIQERAESGSKGQNWLFFGDQHFESDFLYQSEWLKFRKNGILNNIDIAFSRDQEEKVYVQNRLSEKASEVYSWIKNGAYIYVCGDKDKMAKDVREAFVEIFQKQGGLSKQEAEDELLAFRKSNRYQEDVY